MSRKFIIIGLALAVIVGLFAVLLALRTPTATVSILTLEYDLRVAKNAAQQARGLSGTDLGTLGAEGMIFLFDEKEERVFWMNEMNYDLDVLWVADGLVVKIDENVPAPKEGEEPVKMYSRPFRVDAVIELPAGTVARDGLILKSAVIVDGYPKFSYEGQELP